MRHSVSQPTSYATCTYSTCSIAYAYVTRHLCISPLAGPTTDEVDYHEARRQISLIVPFLIDRKAKFAFPSLSSAVTDIWSRLDVVRLFLLVFLRWTLTTDPRQR
jgi:hypothetical protein